MITSINRRLYCLFLLANSNKSTTNKKQTQHKLTPLINLPANYMYFTQQNHPSQKVTLKERVIKLQINNWLQFSLYRRNFSVFLAVLSVINASIEGK